MEEYKRRAEEADRLITALTKRVEALESQKGGSSGPINPLSITQEVYDKVRKSVETIRNKCAKIEAENEKLKSEIAKLKKQPGKGGGNAETKKLNAEIKKLKADAKKNNAKCETVKGDLLKLRNGIVKLQEEKKELEKQLDMAGGPIPTTMTEDQIEVIKKKLKDIRAMVEEFMSKKDAVEAQVTTSAPAGMVRQNMDTIKERKTYFVTSDLAELKKEWYAAELGELDDEDFQLYLGREVKSIDIEEDDDTVNCRFDNQDTQWFPVTVLFEKGAAPAAAPAPAVAAAPAGGCQMTMDTIKERKHYMTTSDLAHLKKLWYEAELGELDDDDFKLYLGRKVYAIDIEEDDDTINCRFDNHDTQWFPVGTLYSITEGAPAPAAPQAAPAAPAAPGMVQMTMDTIKERKTYFVTSDLVQLKKLWYEAELGELDDEDFQLYLGREVKSIDIEEDDDTINCRFDNQDTQWFPVGCLFEKGGAAPAPAAAKPFMTMDNIKERQYYVVTSDLAHLKKLWAEAELGELDDEDFQGYLGRKVYGIDIEEDDDTINVRFDNHDTQWFPVGTLHASD